jgi:prepilin-type N-terminal cleavage/methylation domain-containing protein
MLARSRLGRQTGMTLLEVIVGLLIVALLGAVVVPQITRRQRDGQAAAIASSLGAIRTAILEFRKSVGRYPSQLAHLSTLPTAGATDLCGRVVPFVWSGVWRGPYVQRAIGSGGVLVRDAVILNAIRRNPPTSATTLADLLLDVTNVDQSVAEIIDQNLDPTLDLNAGSVQWVSTGSGQGTLTLAMPIRGC